MAALAYGRRSVEVACGRMWLEVTVADEKLPGATLLDDHSKFATAMGLEIGTLVAELMKEGQRALVVAGAARLDLALEYLLKRSMTHHSGGSDNLFDADRPLGSFASKIALAPCAGDADVGPDALDRNEPKLDLAFDRIDG